VSDTPAAYYLLEYDFAADYLARRAPLREEHLRLLTAAHDAGEVILAGALADPADRGLIVWQVADPATIHRFVDADPYVSAGLVTAWRVRPWNVVVGGSPSTSTGPAAGTGTT
jgi:uncharacterized protein YciI